MRHFSNIFGFFAIGLLSGYVSVIPILIPLGFLGLLWLLILPGIIFGLCIAGCYSWIYGRPTLRESTSFVMLSTIGYIIAAFSVNQLGVFSGCIGAGLVAVGYVLILQRRRLWRVSESYTVLILLSIGTVLALSIYINQRQAVDECLSLACTINPMYVLLIWQTGMAGTIGLISEMNNRSE